MIDYNTGKKNRSSFPLSPFPFYINTLLFTILALTTRYYLTLLLEFIFLFFLLALCTMFSNRKKPVSLRAIFSLIPLFIFIISVNSFRGGGEIIFELWHFHIIKQGVYRGFYFSGVVLLLFIMSRFLIMVFDENEILSSVTFFRNRKKNNKDESGNLQLLLIIVYVIKILKFAYEEMKVFFERNRGKLKMRFLEFFIVVFNRAELEYHHFESINLSKVSLKVLDPLVVFIQGIIAVLVLKLKWWGI